MIPDATSRARMNPKRRNKSAMSTLGTKSVIKTALLFNDSVKTSGQSVTLIVISFLNWDVIRKLKTANIFHTKLDIMAWHAMAPQPKTRLFIIPLPNSN